MDGNLPRYEWTLPHFHFDNEPRECIFRIRYNISTNDYPVQGLKTCLTPRLSGGTFEFQRLLNQFSGEPVVESAA